MVEQRNADVRTVGSSLRQKELLGIVLDAIQSLRSSVCWLALHAVHSVYSIWMLHTLLTSIEG
jgi:hypothetical protein